MEKGLFGIICITRVIPWVSNIVRKEEEENFVC